VLYDKNEVAVYDVYHK